MRKLIKKGTKEACRHCGRLKYPHARHLCWACYYTAGVRDLYPSTSKFARRSVQDFNGKARLGPPTPYRPGSPGKQAILHLRAMAREELFHPLDAGWESVLGGSPTLEATA